MPTTSYTFSQLFGSQGEGTSSISLTAGTPYTFALANNSGSSYFVMETAQPNDTSSLPKNTSGSYTSLTNIASSVIGDYITGFALPTGVNSFVFTPSINVTGSSLRLRGTGGITLEIDGGSLPPFINPTLTTGSAVSIISQSPFGSGNSYSFISSVNSYITTPGSNDWAVGTGDFTVEWFSYQTTLTSFQRIFSVGDYPNMKIGSSIESGTFYYWANDTFRYNSSSASTANQWIHWAIVRQSGVTKVYRNGTQLGLQITDVNNIVDNTTTFVVGNTNTFATNSALVGYLTSFRFIKGLAVYTGNFTVPTSPLTATATANPYGGSNTQAIGDGFTKLLLVP